MTLPQSFASWEDLSPSSQAPAITANVLTQPRVQYSTPRDQLMDEYMRLNPSIPNNPTNENQFSWPTTGATGQQSSLFALPLTAGSLASSEGPAILQSSFGSAFDAAYQVPSASAVYVPAYTEVPGFYTAMNHFKPLHRSISYNGFDPSGIPSMSSFDFQEHFLRQYSGTTTRPEAENCIGLTRSTSSD